MCSDRIFSGQLQVDNMEAGNRAEPFTWTKMLSQSFVRLPSSSNPTASMLSAPVPTAQHVIAQPPPSA